MSAAPGRLTLYGMSDCGLCEKMWAELAPLAAELGFEVEYVDIDGAPDLVGRYGERIPVLTGTCGEICSVRLDVQRLRAYFSP